MPKSQTYRAGAIGRTGGGNYGHGLHLAFRGVENVEFVAVADADEAGRRKAVAEAGAAREYADYRQMLERERLDIVSVCPRWVDCHVEMVLACLDAGCHVYCEKPMTASLAEGDHLVAAAQRAGRKVAVAHQGVYLPGAQTVKQLLGEGRIGTIQAIYAHGKQDRRGGGEDMITLGTHLMNMMRFFVGDVAWMSAHITVEGREMTGADARQPTEPVGLVAGDAVNSYFAFRNGVAGFFDSRQDQPGAGTRYGMEITGGEGIIAIRGGAADAVAVYPHSLFIPLDSRQRWEPVPIPDVSLATGNQLAIRDLIDAIEEDREPLSSAAGAVAALEMILGAYESQLTGARVQFPMKNREHPLA
jgi:predicted dehydrogenase